MAKIPGLDSISILIGGDVEAVFRSVHNSLAEGIVCCDLEGRTVYANKAFLETIGWEFHEIVGKRIYEFLFGDDPELIHQQAEKQHKRYESRVKGASEDYELTILTKGGERRIHEVRASPLRTKNGKVVGSIGVILDVTDERVMQEKFMLGEKMEAVVSLAGGVAHDFNNLLTVISGYASMLLQRTPENDSARKPLSAIADATNSAHRLTQQLLTLSRRNVVQQRVVHLGRLLHRNRDMLTHVIGDAVRLELDTSCENSFITADPNQIQQVLLNLAINARDAMPEGGTLSIRTRVESGTSALAGPRNHVVIEIRDTGIGMDEKTRKRIFDPFFTTKKRGSGLGLSTTFKILKEHSAEIQIDSALGKGTAFKFFFAQADGKEQTIAPSSDPSEFDASNTYLLVVEDEIEVREFVADLLESQGYLVQKASDGQEALEILEHARNLHRISVVLTDIVMPNMNGFELAKYIVENHPETAVLTMSGCLEDSAIGENVRKHTFPFIAKPFAPEELLAQLRELLKHEQVVAQNA